MSAQPFKKRTETSREAELMPQSSEVTKKIGPEAKDLTDLEKQDLKREVLREVEKAEKVLKTPPKVGVVVPKEPVIIADKSQILLQIESILEQDLQEVYFGMGPADQYKFKTQGDQTAVKIEKLLAEAKVKTKKIFTLIVEWLKIIPGVNKFFIRQEAKIKTSRIMNLKK